MSLYSKYADSANTSVCVYGGVRGDAVSYVVFGQL